MIVSRDLKMDAENIETVVRTEVEMLHRFLTDWFSGRCASGREYFAQEFKQRFDQQFLLIPPAGSIVNLDMLCRSIYSRYASNPNFRIAIRQVRVWRVWNGHVLATYEEWQRNALASTPPNNGRIATVVLHVDDKLTWLHVHETWLPQDIMNAGPYDF